MKNRRNIRLKQYDYSKEGYYFITICTQNREYMFGSIKNNKMRVKPAGTMIHTWWNAIDSRYENVKTDEFQIMPNHIHGIIQLVGVDQCVDPVTDQCVDPVTDQCVDPVTDQCVDPVHNGRTHDDGDGRTHWSAPTGVAIGQIIQWFKTMSTNEYIRNVKTNNWKPFDRRLWQRNYYERIVRTDNELNNIRHYITSNPIMWEKDTNNVKTKEKLS